MAKKKEEAKEEKAKVSKKKLPTYSGEQLANLKSGDFYPLEADKTYILFGGTNLQRDDITAVKLADLIKFISD